MIVVEPGDRLDRMRRALADCTMLPGSNQKRVARNLSGATFDRISERGWNYVIVLARKYRRQMPASLIPTEEETAAAQAALREAREAKDAALFQRRNARIARKEARGAVKAATPLFGDVAG